MAMKTVVYLTVILLTAHCSIGHQDQEKTENDPVNYVAGEPAVIGQYPFLARLVFGDNDTITDCGGSLISDRYVLTAAHCLKNQKPEDIKIYLGDYDTSKFPEDCLKDECVMNARVETDKVLIHEDYGAKPRFSNDIGLLRLTNKAPFSDSIQPISLPPFDIDSEEHAFIALRVVGWGRMRSLKTPTTLQTAEIYQRPRSICETIFPNLPAKHVCAGDISGKDTCDGDSGGPLLLYYKEQYYVSGIVSFGPPICGVAVAGAYTNVFRYKDWILKSMKD